ncbi:hypothetical protein [Butyricicoccus sp.]|uniref:hypothetical protein n=1 Tax=Butyricicoccus sp. TaxID=2049021 RepID=UPI003F14210B
MKHPNRCRWIMKAIIVAGIALAGLSGIVSGVEPIHPMFVLGAVLALGGVVFGVITVRCPFCGHSLDMHGFRTDYCPHCGEKLG